MTLEEAIALYNVACVGERFKGAMQSRALPLSLEQNDDTWSWVCEKAARQTVAAFIKEWAEAWEKAVMS